MTVARRWVTLAAAACVACADRAATEDATAEPDSGAPRTLVTTESARIAGLVDLLVTDDGRVYLADGQANTILVLDSAGRVERTIGRGGAGPGEFSRMTSLVQRGDTLAVVDWGNGRLQLLSLDGAPLGTVPLPGSPGQPAVGHTGLVVSPTWGMDTVLAVVHGADGTERGRIGRIVGETSRVVRPAAMKEAIARGEIPAIFLNSAEAVSGADGRIWLTVAARGSIEQFDSLGAPLWSAVLPDEDRAGVLENFVAKNAAMPGMQFFPPRFILDAQIVGEDLWILLGPSLAGTATIRVLHGDGSLGERIDFSGVTEAALFGVDLRRRLAYFSRPETAELVRTSF